MKNTNRAFTMLGAGQHAENSRKSLVNSRKFNKEIFLARSAHNELSTNDLLLTTKAIGFTMAEILLSLTIIGVVAAITLPSLTGNINERTWNTQRKALYARISQAISLMPALNNFGVVNATTDTASETFLTAGLSKVLKINNICDNTHFNDCGMPSSYANMLGTKSSIPTTLYSLNGWFSQATYSDDTFSTKDTKATAFETQNGESIVAYYNQTCRTEYLNQEALTQYGNRFGFPEATMCLNFIYDLNGKKGPNTIGKDMGFITVFNATDSIVVAPMPSSSSNAGGNDATYQWKNSAKACTDEDNESRIPNIDEASAMLINKDLINLTENGVFWSGSVMDSAKAWRVNAEVGNRLAHPIEMTFRVRCIKR